MTVRDRFVLFLLQVSMLSLVVYKYYNSPRRRKSIMTAVLRDGALAFTVLFGMYLFLLPKFSYEHVLPQRASCRW